MSVKSLCVGGCFFSSPVLVPVWLASNARVYSFLSAWSPVRIAPSFRWGLGVCKAPFLGGEMSVRP